MYMNTSFKYHRITDTQSRVMTKVHDLLGQPSHMHRETLKILLGRFRNYLTQMVIERPSTKITNLRRGMRFPTMWHLTCVDSDEPLQPPFKLRNSKGCSVSSLTVIGYSRD